MSKKNKSHRFSYSSILLIVLISLLNGCGISDGFVRRSGQQVCQLIKKAQDMPGLKLKNKASAAKKTQQQEGVLDVLSGIVRLRADENSLNPVILATRKDLESLLFNEHDCCLLHGWRYSMVGQELQSVLQGKFAILVDKDNVLLREEPEALAVEQSI